MKTLFFLLLLFIGVDSFAQTPWVESGAYWYYYYSSYWTGSGYETISYERDSLLQNRNCQGLKRDRYYEDSFSGDTIHLDLPVLWIHQEGDSIWQFDANQDSFFLLYQFGRSIGDTLDQFQGAGWDFWTTVVIDTGTLLANGVPLQTQRIGVFENGAPQPYLELEIAEKIGFLSYPFNFFWYETGPGLVDGPEWAVSCYQADQFPLVNLASFPCIEWYVSSAEDMNDQAPSLQLFPNPMTDKVSLRSSLPITSLTVLNLAGQQVYQTQALPTESELEVGAWEAGIYLFCFHIGEQLLTRRMVKLPRD